MPRPANTIVPFMNVPTPERKALLKHCEECGRPFMGSIWVFHCEGCGGANAGRLVQVKSCRHCGGPHATRRECATGHCSGARMNPCVYSPPPPRCRSEANEDTIREAVEEVIGRTIRTDPHLRALLKPRVKFLDHDDVVLLLSTKDPTQ